MDAFKTYFLNVFTKHYVDFNGRATRTQYWMFVLFTAIIMSALFILGMLPKIGNLFYVIYVLCQLALFLPNLSITARRLHDTDRSGWWQLIAIVPLIGAIILLVFLVLPSTPGANRFGSAK